MRPARRKRVAGPPVGSSLSCVRKVLVTGMSGTVKSTVLAELRRRGFRVVDTDAPGWAVWDERDDGYLWQEDRIPALLSIDEGRTLYVAGSRSRIAGHSATRVLGRRSLLVRDRY
jgi:hypothetical protein